MFKKTILISLLAAASSATFAADYYVVAPLPGKQHLVDGISVALSTTPLPAGVVGVPYAGFNLSSALQVSGDPAYSSSNVGWSVVAGALPAGLVLNKGVISGTPTAAGAQTFSVRATYKTKTGEQAYQLVTFAVTVALATGTLPQGVTGVAYPAYDLKPLLTVVGDAAFNPANVVWTVVSSTLPAGLTLKADGTLSGTPTVSGTGTLVARAAYRGVNGEQTYQVVTLGIAVALATATLPQGIVGLPYAGFDLKTKLTVSGDAAYTGAGVTWGIASGSLPAGLSLNTDGTISGMPTAAGTGTVTARATYKGVHGEQSYQLVALNITVGLLGATLPEAIAGKAYSYDFKPLVSATGDPSFSSANVTFSLSSSSAPPGLGFTTAGVLSGIPTTAIASHPLSVVASYRGKTGTTSYTMNVASATYTIDYLIVAGGGGGGGSNPSLGGGGGGGGGGVLSGSRSITPGSPANYAISIGAGGGAYSVSCTNGSNGGNTTGFGVTAIGGGGGGNGCGNGAAGLVGGSGGGGGYNSYATPGSGGASLSGQGFGGGATTAMSSASGAGGGGAGGAGAQNQLNHFGGLGGAGLVSSLAGASVTYAAGGKGGGGSHAASLVNTGKGGDAAYAQETAHAGGSGVVVIRYLGAQRGTGGAVTSAGGYTSHTFTSSGTYTP